MKIFPILEEEYLIDESIPSFINRLEVATDSKQSTMFFRKNPDNSRLFYGQVSESNFVISRNITHSNSFNQVILGYLSETEHKTKIILVYKTDKNVRLFVYLFWSMMLFFFIITLSVDLFKLFNHEISLFSLIIIFMFLCSKLVIKYAYNLDINNTRNVMKKFVLREM